jgi:hypothetical protein
VALPLLEAMIEGQVQTISEGKVFIVKDGTTTDPLTGKVVGAPLAISKTLIINNRIRRRLRAIAAPKLASKTAARTRGRTSIGKAPMKTCQSSPRFNGNRFRSERPIDADSGLDATLQAKTHRHGSLRQSTQR